MSNEQDARQAPVFVRAFCTPEVKDVNTRTREVTHLINSAAIDRAGDIVEPSGAEVANYMRNPVVLADHDYSIQSVIGRASRLSIDESGIHATTRFHDKGLGAEAFDLVKAGMVRAWSVGFKPIETESVKDKGGVTRGFHFKKWELLEYSLVAIPANPDAVMEAVQRGLVTRDNTQFFFRSVLPEGQPSQDAPSGATAEPATGHMDDNQKRRWDFLLDFSRRLKRDAQAHHLRRNIADE